MSFQACVTNTKGDDEQNFQIIVFKRVTSGSQTPEKKIAKISIKEVHTAKVLYSKSS